MMKGFGSMSDKMATVLKIAGASRMNVVISGGTGSGKTTMLNALSKMIDPGERVITIEDAAELRLQQPHWLPLETRPANLEGQGAISIGDLVINALRMRPDRIILGEIRGKECFDLLAAMNTAMTAQWRRFTPTVRANAWLVWKTWDDVATSRCPRKRSAARSRTRST